MKNNIFNKCILKEKLLLNYGFKRNDDKYYYSKNILNETFRIDIIVENNKLEGKIYDLSFNEEYTNFRINDIKGDFVGKIREKYIELLNDIRDKCTESKLFKFDQANRICKLIKDKYNDEPNFEWEKFPGYATFKNSKTNKWYGIIMNIEKNKLNKKLTGEAQIIDIKLSSEKIEELLNMDGFYQAYHMNKKNWITIILDDTIQDEFLIELIEESHSYSNIN